MSTPVPEPGPVAPIHPGDVGEDPERPEGLAPTPDPEPEARWRPWTAPVALIAALFASLLGGLLVIAVAAATGARTSPQPPVVNLVSTVIQDLCFIGAALVFAALVARPRPWHFGLRPPPARLKAAGWTVVTFVAFLVFSAVWIKGLGLEHEKETLPEKLGAKDSDAALVAVAFLVCVLAPLAEEFFFRGFFFRAIVNWHGVWPAAIITGVVFGGIHASGSPVGFLVPLAFLGFALCGLYAFTRSLVPCIVVHCVNNSIAYGGAVGWTWQIPVAAVSALAVLGAILLVVRRIAGAPPAPAPPLAAAQPA